MAGVEATRRGKLGIAIHLDDVVTGGDSGQSFQCLHGLAAKFSFSRLRCLKTRFAEPDVAAWSAGPLFQGLSMDRQRAIRLR